MTLWKKKSRYIAEPLNKVNSSYEKGSLSGTKNVPSGTKNVPSDATSVPTECCIRKQKPRANIHKSSKQFATEKCQRNARYNMNLKERK